MCTAVAYKTKDFYFGRTLDYEFSYGEQIAVTPRNFPLPFRHKGTLDRHYAIIGMAHIAQNYPLYYDAVNEKGLAMAGLNFVGFAKYNPYTQGKDNIANFEFIPWILAQCATVFQAKALLAKINLTDDAFSHQLPPAQLHWIIADRDEAIAVESVAEGLRIYPNPVGVLTNNPPFPYQLMNLNNYINLTSKPAENRFSTTLCLEKTSRGMGAIGLPGDWSSSSRFVRAAFVKENAANEKSVEHFFAIMSQVRVPKGCMILEDGEYEYTRYTSCMDFENGVYYYKGYDDCLRMVKLTEQTVGDNV